MRGVGIDIAEVDRFEQKIDDKAFLELVFTESERQFCLNKGNKAECLASRFAAKEAYMKCIGEGWSNKAQFHEIELVKTQSGKPKLVLHGGTLSHFNQNFNQIHLSISHTKTTAVAVVIVE